MNFLPEIELFPEPEKPKIIQWTMPELPTWKGAGEWIYAQADYSLVVILFGMLLSMFGSKIALKIVYWTFAVYIIIKAIGGALL